jgi:hypothetical protein
MYHYLTISYNAYLLKEDVIIIIIIYFKFGGSEANISIIEFYVGVLEGLPRRENF